MEGKMIGQHLKSEENIEGRGEMVTLIVTIDEDLLGRIEATVNHGLASN